MNTIDANQVPFSAIPVNSIFFFEGVKWHKRSTRTAQIPNRPKYWKPFSKNDLVTK